MGMKNQERKQDKISIEDAMRKYARLEREGKLPMDTEEFSPSISAEVLRKLRQNAKDSESR